MQDELIATAEAPSTRESARKAAEKAIEAHLSQDHYQVEEKGDPLD